MQRSVCFVLVALGLGALGCDASRSGAPELGAAVASARSSADAALKIAQLNARLEEANRRVQNLDSRPVTERERREHERINAQLERGVLEERAAGFVAPPRPPPRPCHCKPTDPLCDCL